MTKKEYINNQTSWRYFERKVDQKRMQNTNGSMCIKEIELRMQIEILKELQYLNAKK